MSLRYLTAGESHGKGLSGILEGIPSGLEIDKSYIQHELSRRKLGYGRGARQKIETDEVQILSGIRHGKTLGSPIALWIENRDWKNWEEILSVEPPTTPVKRQVQIPRPGHADYIGGIKYDHADMRNVLERSSARETAMRVALGAVTRKFLESCGISIGSRVVQIGKVSDANPYTIEIPQLNEELDKSPVRCSSPDVEANMIKEIESHKKAGDTLGGHFEVMASGVPIGLGSYSQWDRRLEGLIGQQFLSLNAIKGVEIGLGFKLGTLPGSQSHDEFFPGSKLGTVSYKTNRSGGVDGGMSTGQTIRVGAVMKPISTLMTPLRSVDLTNNQPTKAHVERSDVCAVPSAAVIGESLLAFALGQAILEKFGGDSMNELLGRLKEWNANTVSK